MSNVGVISKVVLKDVKEVVEYINSFNNNICVSYETAAEYAAVKCKDISLVKFCLLELLEEGAKFDYLKAKDQAAYLINEYDSFKFI